MSSQEQALLSLFSHVALSFDGAVLGVILAVTAARSVIKYCSNSTALETLRSTPSVSVGDLRSILDSSDDESSGGSQKIVIVRGTVEAKVTSENSWKSDGSNFLVSRESGDRAVIIQRTQTCIYNEWKGLLGWTSDFRALFAKSRREQESISLRMAPFVLVDRGRSLNPDFVVVNMEGSKHSLPLITVYHQLQPVNASPYTFLQALFGHEYPVGLLDEEKILPLGKDITAVGLCSTKNGITEIKSCKNLPYFLSDFTKDQMILELSFKTRVLFWSGIVLGSLSIGVLGYAIYRNWNRWKSWRQQRQIQQSTNTVDNDTDQIASEDETEDVLDGQLCVICLMRRRRSAFIPCGHLVCCQRCAISVEREVAPKCPVCRQQINNSVRIFDS